MANFMINLVPYILLLVGFWLLIKGADIFVDGSSNIARLLKIPTIIIGLTVVAFGTSMPEASVSITAAIKGANALAISNVIGSNIFTLLVVLDMYALINPVRQRVYLLKMDVPLSIMITCFLSLFLIDSEWRNFLSCTGADTLCRFAGISLLILFVLFLASTVKDALCSRAGTFKEAEKARSAMSLPKSVFFIAAGIAGIICGGNLVVDSASDIALSFGLSETFVGLTIVALGTSLPELVTSVVASRKNENDLAIGNVIGSNIFNILLILGASAAISPIQVDASALYDTLILVAVSIIGYILTLHRRNLDRRDGILLLVMYVLFFIYILIR